MHPFQCPQCSGTVFFENDQCTRCGSLLGVAPASASMLGWAAGSPPPQPACANRDTEARCNWMCDSGDGQALCRSCRLTQVLPPLDVPGNGARWRTIEQAKRRLVFTLLGLGLGLEPKTGPDDTQGLAFHLLASQSGGPPVKTGHENGTITLDVAEADDDHREAERVRLNEPTRTLLGHLRHETAHYLQWRWIAGTAADQTCRDAFGDETADYAQALARHYAEGPPADWPQQYVSAYASAHPWEDWAETCAHYLLMLDAVQTAGAWGLQLNGHLGVAVEPIALDDAPQARDLVLQHWLPVAQFLTAMNRSLGQRDSYPFLLPPAVLHKLEVVQTLLRGAAGAPAPQPG
ncbi:MAG: putative zinc-binding metallopeptidase [Pseudomonadota bacterium]